MRILESTPRNATTQMLMETSYQPVFGQQGVAVWTKANEQMKGGAQTSSAQSKGGKHLGP